MNPIFVQNFRTYTMSPFTQQALYILIKTAIWIPLLPAAIGLSRFNKYSYGLRSLVLWAMVSFATDMLNDFFRGSTTYFDYSGRVYTILEFTLFSIFFFAEFSQPLIRRIIVTINILFVGLVITDYFLQSKMQFDDLPTGVESAIFLIYSLALLYLITKDMLYPNLLATSQFWVISGIMIYFGGNIFLFLSSNYLISTSKELFDVFWFGVHATLVISLTVLISIGLWKARKQYQ